MSIAFLAPLRNPPESESGSIFLGFPRPSPTAPVGANPGRLQNGSRRNEERSFTSTYDRLVRDEESTFNSTYDRLRSNGPICDCTYAADPRHRCTGRTFERGHREERQPSSSTGSSPSSSAGDSVPRSFHRNPRSPRPTYSEEQRFFVMYARLVQDKPWPAIEEGFANIFKQRSKGGLCSLYYRIRRSWGLEDVLKSDANYWALERRIVDEKAFFHSQDFLLSIGYLR